MIIALAVLAALETAAPSAPSAVEMTRSGSAGAPVSAAPRSLSDVARELREGRRAVGGFSAVETTLPRAPFVIPVVEWDEEDARREPEVVPEPQPPWSAVPYVSAWPGGWTGGAPVRRPPHVRHFVHAQARAVPRPSAGPSPRPGGPQVSRSASLPPGVGMREAFPRR